MRYVLTPSKTGSQHKVTTTRVHQHRADTHSSNTQTTQSTASTRGHRCETGHLSNSRGLTSQLVLITFHSEIGLLSCVKRLAISPQSLLKTFLILLLRVAQQVVGTQPGRCELDGSWSFWPIACSRVFRSLWATCRFHSRLHVKDVL